jgi:hypothetical protein
MQPTFSADGTNRNSRRAILVLGMHRSGTSALSGVVSALGASPPNHLVPANSSNARGYWESLPLMSAHDELLASAGSSWDDWRRLDVHWFSSREALIFRDKLRLILQSEYEDNPLLIVKDPRICRFLPFFVSVLTDMTVVPVALLILRNPLEVAFSMRRRNGFGIAKSIALWLRHVLEAEYHSRGMLRHFVFYEDLLKDWRSEMTRAGDSIRIDWPADLKISAETVEKFLVRDLYHEKSELKNLKNHPDLGPFTVEAYRLLRAIAKTTKTHKLFKQIDDLRTKFDQVSDFFGAAMGIQEIQAGELSPELIDVAQQRRALVSQADPELHELREDIMELQNASVKNEDGQKIIISNFNNQTLIFSGNKLIGVI